MGGTVNFQGIYTKRRDHLQADSFSLPWGLCRVTVSCGGSGPVSWTPLQGFLGIWTFKVALLSLMGCVQFSHPREKTQSCSVLSTKASLKSLGLELWSTGWIFWSLVFIVENLWYIQLQKSNGSSKSNPLFQKVLTECSTKVLTGLVLSVSKGVKLITAHPAGSQQGQQCWHCLCSGKIRVQAPAQLYKWGAVYFVVSSTEIPYPNPVIVGCSVILVLLPVIISWDYQG